MSSTTLANSKATSRMSTATFGIFIGDKADLILKSKARESNEHLKKV